MSEGRALDDGRLRKVTLQNKAILYKFGELYSQSRKNLGFPVCTGYEGFIFINNFGAEECTIYRIKDNRWAIIFYDAPDFREIEIPPELELVLKVSVEDI